MMQAERLSEFEEFARSKGHEADKGVVAFGQDEAAAKAFDREAYKAGFQTVVGISQGKWTHGQEDSADWPKEWGVNLV
jgi:hypothetical protein